MSLISLLKFRSLGDERGELVALEGERNIPFPIRRVYYMTGMKADEPRGFHAHRKLQQVAICVAGRCRMVLDDGRAREEVWLDQPDVGLVIGDLVWREMHDFSSDCVLLVLASELYDEADYIRDYDAFLKVVQNG
ncbi:sugar 3,4-ketoisomerase [Aliihoeflea sp. PC F10.4]